MDTSEASGKLNIVPEISSPVTKVNIIRNDTFNLPHRFETAEQYFSLDSSFHEAVGRWKLFAISQIIDFKYWDKVIGRTARRNELLTMVGSIENIDYLGLMSVFYDEHILMTSNMSFEQLEAFTHQVLHWHEIISSERGSSGMELVIRNLYAAIAERTGLGEDPHPLKFTGDGGLIVRTISPFTSNNVIRNDIPRLKEGIFDINIEMIHKLANIQTFVRIQTASYPYAGATTNGSGLPSSQRGSNILEDVQIIADHPVLILSNLTTDQLVAFNDLVLSFKDTSLLDAHRIITVAIAERKRFMERS